MDFPAALIPAGLAWPANALFAAVMWLALQRAPLSRLLDNRFSHLFFAACVMVLMLWNTRAGVLPALNFHLLGMTVITLMFDWPLAMLLVLVVLTGSAAYNGDSLASLGLDALVMGGIPVLVTTLLLRFAQRRLPHNFFVYVYVNGFLAAGFSILLSSLAGAGVMLASDASHAGWLGYQYYPYFPLVFFAEAVLNGMLITALVALRPQWVCSFDDERYIHNK